MKRGNYRNAILDAIDCLVGEDNEVDASRVIDDVQNILNDIEDEVVSAKTELERINIGTLHVVETVKNDLNDLSEKLW